MATFKMISLKCCWNEFVRTNPGNFCRLSLLHFVLWDLPSLAALEGVPVCQQWYQRGSVFRLNAALRTWLSSLTYLISFGWLLFTEIHFDLSLLFVSSFAHLAKLTYCMYWRKEGPTCWLLLSNFFFQSCLYLFLKCPVSSCTGFITSFFSCLLSSSLWRITKSHIFVSSFTIDNSLLSFFSLFLLSFSFPIFFFPAESSWTGA